VSLKAGPVSRCGIDLHVWDVHDEYCADHDALEASKDGVRNDRECLVDYHVQHEQGHEEEAILTDGLDFLCAVLLLP